MIYQKKNLRKQPQGSSLDCLLVKMPGFHYQAQDQFPIREMRTYTPGGMAK